MIIPAQLSKLGLFDARVPRYTSYPTSPHFSKDVGETHFIDWLHEIPAGRQVSLYVHVPFCRRLCWFCACRTQGTRSDAPVRAYLEILKAELAMLGRHLPANVTLSRLHWGGGTPTMMAPDMIEELAAAISAVTPFAENTEFSVEIDPNEIDGDRLDALARAGMNRASVGVQDFNNDIQQIIGRIQGYDITKQAIDEIRARGVRSLNADILFGLPDQSRAAITESVQKLLSLNPDRVALYGYAHVPWMAKRQQLIPSDRLPTPQERLALYDTARRLFMWDGYNEIGIDHFATPQDGLSTALANGRLRRNFQGYTDDTADVLIGVGASSISRFPQGFIQNAGATGAHAAAIRKGRFAAARGHVFAGQDRLRARMIEQLMCEFRVDAAEMTTCFDIGREDLMDMLRATNRKFDGLLTVNDEGLFIPPQARPLTRMIARSFDRYELSAAGHSSAI